MITDAKGSKLASVHVNTNKLTVFETNLLEATMSNFAYKFTAIDNENQEFNFCSYDISDIKGFKTIGDVLDKAGDFLNENPNSFIFELDLLAMIKKEIFTRETTVVYTGKRSGDGLIWDAKDNLLFDPHARCPMYHALLHVRGE